MSSMPELLLGRGAFFCRSVLFVEGLCLEIECLFVRAFRGARGPYRLGLFVPLCESFGVLEGLIDVIGRVYNMSQVHQSSPNDSKNKRVTVDIEDVA
ncbi:uncharacterized protein G2W53_039460 [Senna tora]|uniref:Uncharacterized protein n=1 Tax=Senna tora TaxID=362788 RepID=A0A834T1D0_9FABA|nr:uncharacterized protein G2W53_039460 [Senna tora]